eukprot:TRINITY_DN33563_c0_g1_i1.p1 TRINITY_DN33563_c0_g1~~TRINITY_DN33563_c0_g1_i1.p1  ORF type:complete len:291 (+),score=65.85 TRINITY_DN33563_c0_g1_i1:50-874(+)
MTTVNEDFTPTEEEQSDEVPQQAVQPAVPKTGNPGTGIAAGGIHHVKNNTGKKNNVLVMSLGGNRFEVLDKGNGGGTDEEVAGLVTRLVHYVAFQDATQTNSDLLAELEDYQRECWERERTRDQRDSKHKNASRSGSKGRTVKQPLKKGERPSRTVPLEEELYLTKLGLSLSSTPNKGFVCLPVNKTDKIPSKRNIEAEPLSSYPSPLLPGSSNSEYFQSDLVCRRIQEMQWLQTDTLRGEKPAKGGGSGNTKTYAAPTREGDDNFRSRTPPTQ